MVIKIVGFAGIIIVHTDERFWAICKNYLLNSYFTLFPFKIVLNFDEFFGWLLQLFLYSLKTFIKLVYH